jgi:phosphoribosylanthranilate isomerase
MNRLRVKICGMKNPENIREAAALHPDYLGFIFYENSPRNFQGEIPEIDPNIKKTGVFVNASVNFILAKVEKYKFQAIQLHGNETSEFCGELKLALIENKSNEFIRNNIEGNSASTEIIKVFSIKDEFDFNLLQPFEGKVDYFLFDSKGKNKGGNGITFNWEVLKDYPSSTPFFLSGGIGLEEVEQIAEFQSYLQKIGKEKLLVAVDVNSRFEIEPGVKNIEDLELFQKNIKFL